MRYLIYDITKNKKRTPENYYHIKQLIYTFDKKMDAEYEIERLLRYDRRVFQLVDTKEYTVKTYKVHSHVHHEVEEATFQPLATYMIYYIHPKSNSHRNKQGMLVADYRTNDITDCINQMEKLKKSTSYVGFVVWNVKENHISEYRHRSKSRTGTQRVSKMYETFEGSLFDYRLKTENEVIENTKSFSHINNRKIVK